MQRISDGSSGLAGRRERLVARDYVEGVDEPDAGGMVYEVGATVDLGHVKSLHAQADVVVLDNITTAPALLWAWPLALLAAHAQRAVQVPITLS